MYEGRRKITLNKKPKKPEVVNEKPDSNVSETEVSSKIPNQEKAEKSEALALVDELTEKDTKIFDDFGEKKEIVSEKSLEEIAELYDYIEGVSKKYQIDPRKFSSENGGFYDPSLIEENLKEAEERRGNFDNRDKKKIESIMKSKGEYEAKKELKKMFTAKMFEAILVPLIDEYNLFGEKTRAYKTCDYDDIKHGIDIVLEYKTEDKDNPSIQASSYVGVGVDLSIGNEETIEEKIAKTRERLEKDIPYKVDYFEDGDGNMGNLKNLVRFIISGSSNTSFLLSEAYRDNEEHGKNRDIEDYRFMTQALEEVLLQVKYYKTSSTSESILKQLDLVKHQTEKVLSRKIEKMGFEEYKKLRQTYDRGYYALKDALEISYCVKK